MPTTYTIKRAIESWPVLVEAAKQQRLLTYKQLAEGAGQINYRSHLELAVICEWCDSEGRPPLTMIVVDGRTFLPCGPWSWYFGTKKPVGTLPSSQLLKAWRSVFVRKWSAADTHAFMKYAEALIATNANGV